MVAKYIGVKYTVLLFSDTAVLLMYMNLGGGCINLVLKQGYVLVGVRMIEA